MTTKTTTTTHRRVGDVVPRRQRGDDAGESRERGEPGAGEIVLAPQERVGEEQRVEVAGRAARRGVLDRVGRELASGARAAHHPGARARPPPSVKEVYELASGKECIVRKTLTKLPFWCGTQSALFLSGRGVLHPLGE